MPCHHRWSQCEQLYILIGSPLTVISITTSSRERQVGHFIPRDIDAHPGPLEDLLINSRSTPTRSGLSNPRNPGQPRETPGVPGNPSRAAPAPPQWRLTTLSTAAALKAMWAPIDRPSVRVLHAR